MFSAQQAFDRMLLDFERDLQEEHHAGELRSMEEQLQHSRSSLRKAGLKCARLQALLTAMEKALSSYEPDHPLLNDVAARNVICEQGMEVFQRGGNLQQVAQLAGTTDVAMPEGRGATYTALVTTLTAVNAAMTQLKADGARHEQRYAALLDDTIRHRTQRAAFRAELGRVAPKHPLVLDAGLRQRVSDAGLSAWAYTVALPDRRWEAVDLAGTTFMLTNRPRPQAAAAGEEPDEVVVDHQEPEHELDESWVPDGPEDVQGSADSGPDERD